MTEVKETTKETAPSKPKGRPPKAKQLEARKKIKHIIRALSPKGIYDQANAAFPAEEVEAYIELFLNDGWELMYIRHLERAKAADGVEVIGELMLYVLVKNV